jgi:hypothetical protein
LQITGEQAGGSKLKKLDRGKPAKFAGEKESKTMKTNLLKISKLAVAVAVVSLACAVQSARAATVKMETQVPGYGWVLVKQDAWPRYAGHVVWDGTRYITDDVARGETMRVTVTAAQGEAPCQNYDVWCYSLNRPVVGIVGMCMPYTSIFTVPLNTAYDNLHVEIWNTLAPYQFVNPRIPIGPRQ